MILNAIQNAVQEPVQVTQSVSGWLDVVRLYILPAFGTLLMGLVALLLEWIRRVIVETSARTLIAAANAKRAAEAAERATQEAALLGETLASGDQRRERQLTEIRKISEATKGISEATHLLVNSAADKAQRQIDQLTEQLQNADIKPKKGNGP